MVYAIDFDGTLCKDCYPDIGEGNSDVIRSVLILKALGHKIILNTCRTNDKLDEAVVWCAEKGIVFDAVNCNLPECIAQFGGDCRKIGADYYVDDRGFGEWHDEFVAHVSDLYFGDYMSSEFYAKTN